MYVRRRVIKKGEGRVLRDLPEDPASLPGTRMPGHNSL